MKFICRQIKKERGSNVFFIVMLQRQDLFFILMSWFKFVCTLSKCIPGENTQPPSSSQTNSQQGIAVDKSNHFDLWLWPSVSLTPWPCPALPPSPPLSHNPSLPPSRRVSGSDREQMLNHTAATKPDTTTRLLPFCHFPLLKRAVCPGDIYHLWYCSVLDFSVTLKERQ